MRQTGELIKRYRGDVELAKQYLGIARVLLGRMKAYLAGAAGQKLWTLPDGVTVLTRSGPMGDLVTITAASGKTATIELRHGLFADVTTPSGFEGDQNFLPAQANENWLPLNKPRLNTHYVGGTFDWSSTDRKDRLNFQGPAGRYFPGTTSYKLPHTRYAEGIGPIYIYQKAAVKPIVVGINDRLTGASIHRSAPEVDPPFANIIVGKVNTRFTSATSEFGIAGVTSIAFYWFPLPTEDGDSSPTLIGYETLTDSTRLMTMTPFNRAGNKCCGVDVKGRVVEWTFTWNAMSGNYDKAFSIVVDVDDATYDSHREGTYFDNSPSGYTCGQLDSEAAAPYDNIVATQDSTQVQSPFREIICADYLDEEIVWLALESSSSIDQSYTASSIEWIDTDSSSGTIAKRLIWSDGTEAWSGARTASSTLTAADIGTPDGVVTLIQSVSGFNSTGTPNVLTGGQNPNPFGDDTRPVVLWADVRSKSVLFITGDMEYSFTHVFLASDATPEAPSHSLPFTTSNTLYLKLSINNVSTDVDSATGSSDAVSVLGSITAAAEAYIIDSLPTCNPGASFSYDTSSTPVSKWGGVQHQTAGLDIDGPLASCTPIQCQDGAEFFLSVANDYGSTIEDNALVNDTRDILGNPWVVFVGYGVTPRTLAYSNLLYLDDAFQDASVALGVNTDELPNPKFINMGSF